MNQTIEQLVRNTGVLPPPPPTEALGPFTSKIEKPYTTLKPLHRHTACTLSQEISAYDMTVPMSLAAQPENWDPVHEKKRWVKGNVPNELGQPISESGGHFDDRATIVGYWQGRRISTLPVGRRWTWNWMSENSGTRFQVMPSTVEWGEHKVLPAPRFSELDAIGTDVPQRTAWNAVLQEYGVQGLVLDTIFTSSFTSLRNQNVNDVRFLMRLAVLYVTSKHAEKTLDHAGRHRYMELDAIPGATPNHAQIQMLVVPADQRQALRDGLQGVNFVPSLLSGVPDNDENLLNVLWVAVQNRNPIVEKAEHHVAHILWPEIPNLKLIMGIGAANQIHMPLVNRLTSDQIWQAVMRWCHIFSDISIFRECVEYLMISTASGGQRNFWAARSNQQLVALPVAKMGPYAIGPLCAQATLQPVTTTVEYDYELLAAQSVMVVKILDALQMSYLWPEIAFFHEALEMDDRDLRNAAQAFNIYDGGAAIWGAVQGALDKINVRGEVGRLLGTTLPLSRAIPQMFNDIVNNTAYSTQWEELARTMPNLPTSAAIWSILYPMKMEILVAPGQWVAPYSISGSRTNDEAFYSLVQLQGVGIELYGRDGSGLPSRRAINYMLASTGRPLDNQGRAFTLSDGVTYEPVIQMNNLDENIAIHTADHIMFHRTYYLDSSMVMAPWQDNQLAPRASRAPPMGAPPNIPPPVGRTGSSYPPQPPPQPPQSRFTGGNAPTGRRPPPPPPPRRQEPPASQPRQHHISAPTTTPVIAQLPLPPAQVTPSPAPIPRTATIIAPTPRRVTTPPLIEVDVDDVVANQPVVLASFDGNSSTPPPSRFNFAQADEDDAEELDVLQFPLLQTPVQQPTLPPIAEIPPIAIDQAMATANERHERLESNKKRLIIRPDAVPGFWLWTGAYWKNPRGRERSYYPIGTHVEPRFFKQPRDDVVQNVEGADVDAYRVSIAAAPRQPIQQRLQQATSTSTIQPPIALAQVVAPQPLVRSESVPTESAPPEPVLPRIEEVAMDAVEVIATPIVANTPTASHPPLPENASRLTLARHLPTLTEEELNKLISMDDSLDHPRRKAVLDYYMGQGLQEVVARFNALTLYPVDSPRNPLNICRFGLPNWRFMGGKIRDAPDAVTNAFLGTFGPVFTVPPDGKRFELLSSSESIYPYLMINVPTAIANLHSVVSQYAFNLGDAIPQIPLPIPNRATTRGDTSYVGEVVKWIKDVNVIRNLDKLDLSLRADAAANLSMICYFMTGVYHPDKNQFAFVRKQADAAMRIAHRLASDARIRPEEFIADKDKIRQAMELRSQSTIPVKLQVATPRPQKKNGQTVRVRGQIVYEQETRTIYLTPEELRAAISTQAAPRTKVIQESTPMVTEDMRPMLDERKRQKFVSQMKTVRTTSEEQEAWLKLNPKPVPSATSMEPGLAEKLTEDDILSSIPTPHTILTWMASHPEGETLPPAWQKDERFMDKLTSSIKTRIAAHQMEVAQQDKRPEDQVVAADDNLISAVHSRREEAQDMLAQGFHDAVTSRLGEIVDVQHSVDPPTSHVAEASSVVAPIVGVINTPIVEEPLQLVPLTPSTTARHSSTVEENTSSMRVGDSYPPRIITPPATTSWGLPFVPAVPRFLRLIQNDNGTENPGSSSSRSVARVPGTLPQGMLSLTSTVLRAQMRDMLGLPPS